jgi:hypothetical protein
MFRIEDTDILFREFRLMRSKMMVETLRMEVVIALRIDSPKKTGL